MLSTTFASLTGYLYCGLLLVAIVAPGPLVNADLIKRGDKHHHHAHHAREEQEPTTNVGTFLRPRPALAFDEEFGELTRTFPTVNFSAAQFFNRNALQKTDDFWRPKQKSMNTALPPAKYFFDACLDTPVGDWFKRAMDGKVLTDSDVTLINNWGTFDKSKNFQAWNWARDGVMAVSCQIISIKYKDMPQDRSKPIDPSIVTTHAEASSQMIANMKKNGWTIEQIAKPSHHRIELERQLRVTKKKNI